MGRHVCPSCQRASRFRWTAASLARQLVFVGVGGIPLGLLFHFSLGRYWGVVGLAVGGLLTGIPLDKLYDGRFRKLEKYETEDAA